MKTKALILLALSAIVYAHEEIQASIPSPDATQLVLDAVQEGRQLGKKKPVNCAKLKNEKKCLKKKATCEWKNSCVAKGSSGGGEADDSTQNPSNDPKSVLFIGNSFTFMNKMPTVLFKKVAESKGNKVTVVDTGTQGGATLGFHLRSQVTTKSLAKQKKYDFIVLQEQSMFLSKSSYSHRWTHSYQWTDEYAKLLNQKGAKPILFQTWAYYNGYEFEDSYDQMQTRLIHGYKDFQKKFKADHNIDADIAPVGEAWKRAYHGLKNPLVLYKTDGRHPQPMGSYLASLTLFCTIFKQSPVGAYKPKGISNTDALRFQKWAWAACQDELGL